MENSKVLEFKSKLIDKGLEVSEFEDILNTIKESTEERKYGLVWEDNVEEVEKELEYKTPILKEEESLSIYKGEEYIDNLLIEGDNLESLTYLKNEGKKVEVIYLDPPYNSLNADGSFVYKDRRLNKEDKYSHSSWVSFMEKRLRLARELLTEDGVMFISIDDRELYNLKLLCDQVFGEDNFISNIVWESKSGGGIDSRFINNVNEYILMYGKDKTKLSVNHRKLDVEGDKRYKFEDEYVEERGKYSLNKLDRASLGYSEKSDFKIVGEDGVEAIPGGTEEENKKKIWRWRWGKEKVEWGLKNGFIEVRKDRNGIGVAYSKQYQNVNNKGEIVERRAPYPSKVEGFKTTTSDREIKDLFGGKVFSYPKPIGLIKHFIKLSKGESLTILDFFAGSGTTGHAILEYNKENGTNHNFILCTNNENNICREVTYQRLNKVINGYTTPKGKEVEGIPSNLKYYKTELVSKEENE